MGFLLGTPSLLHWLLVHVSSVWSFYIALWACHYPAHWPLMTSCHFQNEVQGLSQHSHGAFALPPATLCPSQVSSLQLSAVFYCVFCLCLHCFLFQEYSPPDSSTTWTFQMPLACPAPLTCLPAELKGKDCVT